MNEFEEAISKRQEKEESLISLFLAGDVMTGRGIDQILPYPGDPTIHEPYLKSAKKYVEIAEEANGPIAAGGGRVQGNEKILPKNLHIHLDFFTRFILNYKNSS
jgi:hypothetical protein